MTTLPALFVSHGAPTLPIEASAAREFLSGLGMTFGRPHAILAVSAHWETERPTVSAAAQPETIYDFCGFPEALYRLRYPAPGAAAISWNIAARLRMGRATIPRKSIFCRCSWLLARRARTARPNACIRATPTV